MLEPYRRGFVLSADPIDAPEGYLPLRDVPGLWVHRDTQIARQEDAVVLGRALDVDDGAGRFVVIRHGERGLEVSHDACGLRSVFYSKDRPIVASHASLIGGEKGDRGPYKFGWPGTTTPYKGVHVLTPNTLLEFPAQTVRRYFPSEDLEPLTVDEAIEIVLPEMRAQLASLTKRPLLSLSAGIDSRLSVAVAKGLDVDYFSHLRPGHDGDRIDRAVAEEIARRCGLKYQVIEITEPPAGELAKITAVTRRNSYYDHFRRLAWHYTNLFDDRWIHVRSNLAEIGRAFYRKHKRSGELTPELMAEIHGSRPEPFAEFVRDTQFERSFNYDPFDLFYWEHRMGCWHTHVLLESDLTFDTHVLFNSRRILKAMLAVPLQDRLKATLFHEIIRSELPEIKDIPINPKTWP